MTSFDPNNSDLQQLMADAVTEGLPPQRQAELDRLVREHGGAREELQAYELTATAIDLALSTPNTWQPLPANLREQLIASATPYLSQPLPEQAAGAEPIPFSQSRQTSTPQATSAGFSWTGTQALGWYAALAAVLALAFILLQPPTERVVEVERVVTVPVQPDVAAVHEPVLSERYAELAAKPGVVTAPWNYNPDGGDPRFAQCTGEIIFDPQTQTGYMKLANMPVNDPTQEQYQLWIVDAERPDETTNRVDGGVFNVTDSSEVIVPVNPKIIAEEPVVFALTVERPGGVVVSKGPLQVVAAVQ